MCVGVDRLQGDLGVPQRLAGDGFQETEDIGVLQVGAEQGGAEVERDVGEVEGEGESVEAAEAFDVEDVGAGGDPEAVGHGGGRGHGTDRADLVGDLAVFAQGLRESHQPVESVRVLLGDDDGADAGETFHQALRAEQVQGLADGVARGAVVGAEGGFVRQGAVRETAGQHLVAEQVGELPRPVRAQPTPVGGDGGRAGAGVLSDAFGGHATDHTDGVRVVVLLECCATCRW
ncbi:hypothetical protein OK006_4471 [Actinobacteria bacterium OK006]|nr:hypothetical protein OK006_4471 [Actinobacteria bacterium OK006]